jgi:hypothetical protein
MIEILGLNRNASPACSATIVYYMNGFWQGQGMTERMIESRYLGDHPLKLPRAGG